MNKENTVSEINNCSLTIKDVIRMNNGRENLNILIEDGDRENTVVIDAGPYHLTFAVENKDSVTIIEIDVAEGKSQYSIPKEFFNMQKIEIANKTNA